MYTYKYLVIYLTRFCQVYGLYCRTTYYDICKVDGKAIVVYFRDNKLKSKIWGFHSGDYEECRLLGCGAVYVLC
jgi:hypothetical protein